MTTEQLKTLGEIAQLNEKVKRQQREQEQCRVERQQAKEQRAQDRHQRDAQRMQREIERAQRDAAAALRRDQQRHNAERRNAGAVAYHDLTRALKNWAMIAWQGSSFDDAAKLISSVEGAFAKWRDAVNFRDPASQ